jgi:hypothetical protein
MGLPGVSRWGSHLADCGFPYRGLPVAPGQDAGLPHRRRGARM